jgi:transposase
MKTINAAFCGIDIGKHQVAVHLEDPSGKVLQQKALKRKSVLTFFANLPPLLIGIESCGGSQHWARSLTELGHQVRVINAKHIIPYRRKGKNDLNDAEAICEAVMNPKMPYVSVKSEAQQAVLMLHRMRDQCVSHRKALINQLHAYLLEFGVSLPKGARSIQKHMHDVFEQHELPALVVELLHDQLVAIAREEEREKAFNERIHRWVEQDEVAKTLMALDGIGPLTASAVVATAGSPTAFKNGRQFAAWLGLVPRQYSTGGKSRLGPITKAGDAYLRRLLVQSARTVLLMAQRDRGRQKEWLKQLLLRRPSNVVAVAMAAKQARMIWAVMAGKTLPAST